ncbi:MAG: hypothetical protein H0U07_09620 [Actinobacteria bacterium]|jgi:hypothetical protein|nr:hypothetical protein [Actinomycetota bacterium]MDQ3161869.1 hypothetical protein [Actinomycetota bacterium]
MEASYRDNQATSLRVLFCFGVSQSFFEEEPARVSELAAAIAKAFADLSGRFGLRVLGTMDDDELMVGPSLEWPWTAYILADAPTLDAVRAVCNILRETEIGTGRLWRYMRVEARIGRPLFFGNE